MTDLILNKLSNVKNRLDSQYLGDEKIDSSNFKFLLQPVESVIGPVNYVELVDDLRKYPENTKVIVKCTVDNEHGSTVKSVGARMQKLLTFRVNLTDGINLSVSTFANIDELKSTVLSLVNEDKCFYLSGVINVYNGLFQLKNIEISPAFNRGDLQFRYYRSELNKVKNKNRDLFSMSMIDDVLNNSRSISMAVNHLYKELGVNSDRQFKGFLSLLGLKPFSGEEIIRMNSSRVKEKFTMTGAHYLKFIAIYLALKKGKEGPFSPVNQTKAIESKDALSIMNSIINSYKIQLTSEQVDIAKGIFNKFFKPTCSQGLLYGDTGFGKTVVFGTVAATLSKLGNSTVILCPLESLAKQTFNDFRKYYPELKSNIHLVVGDSKGGGFEHYTNGVGNIYVGTTALLHRSGSFKPYWLVVDEEHRFGVEQRNKLKGETHSLLVTATPIPRTFLKSQSNGLDVYKLTKCFIEKTIRTDLLDGSEHRRELFNAMNTTLETGAQIICVCPNITSNKKYQMGAVNLYESLKSHYGLGVELITGDSDANEKANALSRMLSGASKIVVATTAIEVGVNLPDVRHVVIFNPDRFGLAQLHQIRGRVARLGGWGVCHLYSPTKLKEDTKDKLKFFCSTFVGEDIVEFDAQNRLYGNYMNSGSTSQTGKLEMDSFALGFAPAIKLFQTVNAAVLRAQANVKIKSVDKAKGSCNV